MSRSLLVKDSSAPALPWALFATVFAVLAMSAGFQPITSDSAQMCNAAKNLLEQGAPYVSGEMRPDVIKAADGKHYTKYPLGTVLACVPTVVLQRIGSSLGGAGSALERYFLGLVPSAIGAAGALGFFFLARQLGFGERLAALCALLLVFTTPLWHYARSMYSESLQAALVCWTCFVWLRARGQAPAGWLLLGGFLLGVAINLKILLVVLPLTVLVDRMFDGWERRSWTRFVGFAALGAAPGVMAFFGYNYLRYGKLLATGYTTGGDGSIGFGEPLASGLYGLLFSSGKSVFLYAPLLVLGVAGLPTMLRESRRNLLFFALPVAFVFVAAAKWWDWSGDVAWGPRLVVPVIPLLFVPLLFWMRDARGLRRVLALGAIVVGVYVAFVGVAIRPFQYISAAQPAVGRTLGVRNGEEVPDDLILLHYIPELSPIVGHHWLLVRYLKNERWSVHADYPWKSLNIPAYRLRKDPGPAYINFWFGQGVSYPALIANLLCLGGALYWFSSRLRQART